MFGHGRLSKEVVSGVHNLEQGCCGLRSPEVSPRLHFQEESKPKGDDSDSKEGNQTTLKRAGNGRLRETREELEGDWN